jgi:hypothetical protein
MLRDDTTPLTMEFVEVPKEDKTDEVNPVQGCNKI